MFIVSVSSVRSRPPSKIQLSLEAPDGAPWTLTMAPGMQRFIGSYPRIPGFGSAGPLLEYQAVGCARSG